MTTWFTSDHHFGHENIIEYAGRLFENVEKMDEALIGSWNMVVAPGDIVYHLGDFTLGKEANKYFSRLHGHIKVLDNPWHHDKRWLKYRYPYVEIVDPIVVLERPHVIVLCHYPFAEWDRKHHGSWHLHGHSHNAFNPYFGLHSLATEYAVTDGWAQVWYSWRNMMLQQGRYVHEDLMDMPIPMGDRLLDEVIALGVLDDFVTWLETGHGKRGGRRLDVGVDSAYEKLGSYRPFSMDEIEQYMLDQVQELISRAKELGGK